MSEIQERRSVSPKFSLLHLLTLTALIAIGAAVGIAYRKNRSMTEYRDELLSLSSNLQNLNEGKLASVAMPKVADDFYSWNVNIPEGQDYELRLGLGAISEAGGPPVLGAVKIPAGQHRVTLHTGDSPSEQFRYVVYVDGQPAIEKTMGSDWIPGGWSSASGLSWSHKANVQPAPLELAAQSYMPSRIFGQGTYFNGQSDNYVTRNGYRLCIVASDRVEEPASPFLGIANSAGYFGIGLRDGLRYRSPNLGGPMTYNWIFTRPSLETNQPVWIIAAEFFTDDGASLTSQTKSFQSWQLRDDARGETAPVGQIDPTSTVYTTFLQAKHDSEEAPRPVVEVKWDASRPDEVGIRIAETPANQRIRRWRLRILDGTKHLWRELQIGERQIKIEDLVDSGLQSPLAAVPLEFPDSSSGDIRLRWQTNELLPLQVLRRQRKEYAGMGLYDGLPLTFGIQIPASLEPTLEVKPVVENASGPGQPFPGGPIFEELQTNFETASHDWIWLEAEPK